MSERAENPYPIDLLTPEQFPIYQEWRELFEICHTPPPADVEIGTIVIPTGDWLDRVPTSIALLRERFFSQSLKPRLVVSGKWSHPQMEDGGMGADKVVGIIKNELPLIMRNQPLSEPKSENTKQQAENVYDLMKDFEIVDPIVAVVSTYHLPRFYSTFVSTLYSREGTPVTRLYSVQVDLPWKEEVPMENRGQRWEQVFSEMTRIHNYRQGGDVASFEMIQEYSQWLRN